MDEFEKREMARSDYQQKVLGMIGSLSYSGICEKSWSNSKEKKFFESKIDNNKP